MRRSVNSLTEGCPIHHSCLRRGPSCSSSNGGGRDGSAAVAIDPSTLYEPSRIHARRHGFFDSSTKNRMVLRCRGNVSTYFPLRFCTSDVFSGISFQCSAVLSTAGRREDLWMRQAVYGRHSYSRDVSSVLPPPPPPPLPSSSSQC